jgi:hypothetical protein
VDADQKLNDGSSETQPTKSDKAAEHATGRWITFLAYHRVFMTNEGYSFAE